MSEINDMKKQEETMFDAFISKAYRIVIPKPSRDALQLNIGDLVRVKLKVLKRTHPPQPSEPCPRDSESEEVEDASK